MLITWGGRCNFSSPEPDNGIGRGLYWLEVDSSKGHDRQQVALACANAYELIKEGHLDRSDPDGFCKASPKLSAEQGTALPRLSNAEPSWANLSCQNQVAQKSVARARSLSPRTKAGSFTKDLLLSLKPKNAGSRSPRSRLFFKLSGMRWLLSYLSRQHRPHP